MVPPEITRTYAESTWDQVNLLGEKMFAMITTALTSVCWLSRQARSIATPRHHQACLQSGRMYRHSCQDARRFIDSLCRIGLHLCSQEYVAVGPCTRQSCAVTGSFVRPTAPRTSQYPGNQVLMVGTSSLPCPIPSR